MDSEGDRKLVANQKEKRIHHRDTEAPRREDEERQMDSEGDRKLVANQ